MIRYFHPIDKPFDYATKIIQQTVDAVNRNDHASVAELFQSLNIPKKDYAEALTLLIEGSVFMGLKPNRNNYFSVKAELIKQIYGANNEEKK